MSFEAYARLIRKHADGATVHKEMRAELRKPLPEFRKVLKAIAIALFPGALGRWVAGTRVTMSVRDRGRTAGVRFTGSRKSERNESDLKRLNDQGRVRHPLYGNRKHWYQQTVAAHWFDLAFARMDWYGRAERAMDRAVAKINGGG
jgi:hypothetical protein